MATPIVVTDKCPGLGGWGSILPRSSGAAEPAPRMCVTPSKNLTCSMRRVRCLTCRLPNVQKMCWHGHDAAAHSSIPMCQYLSGSIAQPPLAAQLSSMHPASAWLHVLEQSYSLGVVFGGLRTDALTTLQARTLTLAFLEVGCPSRAAGG